MGLISFERVRAYGAGISITDIHCGEVIIKGTDIDASVFGDGTGIDSPSFTVANSVKVQSSTLVGNLEKPVSVK